MNISTSTNDKKLFDDLAERMRGFSVNARRDLPLRKIELEYYSTIFRSFKFIWPELRSDILKAFNDKIPTSRMEKSLLPDILKIVGISIDKYMVRLLKSIGIFMPSIYYTGLQLMQNQLEEARITLPKSAKLEDATMHFLEKWQFDDFNKLSRDMKIHIREALKKGIKEKWGPGEVTTYLNKFVSFHNGRTYLIVRTETSIAEAAGRVNWSHQRALAEGKDTAYIRVKSRQDCCRYCAFKFNYIDEEGNIIEGRVARTKDVIGKINQKLKPASLLLAIPLHIACACVWITSTEAEYTEQRRRVHAGELINRTFEEVKSLRAGKSPHD